MAGISESIPRRLERLLGELVRRQPLRQAIIGLETGDRSFSWTGAVGAPTPDGTPPTADTPFFLASIDKLLNATIALRLSERRQLDLDARVTAYLPELQPHFPPQDLAADRQKIRYSDTNYMLLIAIIEAVTGQPLHQVHEALLFQPLNLRHTWFVGQSEPVDPTPEPPVLRADGRPLEVPLLLRSLRGIYSTAGDLLTFLRALVQGRVFDQGTTLASMQARWNRFGLPLDRAALRAPGWPIQYGLGTMRFQLPRVLTP